jgi:type II secretory pathway component GspD/PulD (secretin)
MFLQISLAADAQKVTFNKQNASLEDVLKEIRKQTDYNFLYTDEMMKGTNQLMPSLKMLHWRMRLNNVSLASL